MEEIGTGLKFPRSPGTSGQSDAHLVGGEDGQAGKGEIGNAALSEGEELVANEDHTGAGVGAEIGADGVGEGDIARTAEIRKSDPGVGIDDGPDAQVSAVGEGDCIVGRAKSVGAIAWGKLGIAREARLS